MQHRGTFYLRLVSSDASNSLRDFNSSNSAASSCMSLSDGGSFDIVVVTPSLGSAAILEVVAQ
jgi:hypothetical protein